MAYRVIWSPRAVEDVEAIAAYIARDSPSYAAAVVYRILEATRSLDGDAKTGSPISESYDANLREKLAYTYRVIYRIDDETVTVAAIVHTKHLIGNNEATY